ncbi:MAG: hypothetical protein IJI14_07940 [Anaerolineaceae bacterium]|nr:hypothetical protein [Anaerolineaceae bacterium]
MKENDFVVARYLRYTTGVLAALISIPIFAVFETAEYIRYKIAGAKERKTGTGA